MTPFAGAPRRELHANYKPQPSTMDSNQQPLSFPFLSNLQAKASCLALTSPLPPHAADGPDHKALTEKALTHLFDKVRISVEKRQGATASPPHTPCFHSCTQLISWVTAQCSGTCFTYDVKSEARQGVILALLAWQHVCEKEPCGCVLLEFEVVEELVWEPQNFQSTPSLRGCCSVSAPWDCLKSQLQQKEMEPEK